jgi:hypothetical protein
MTISPFFRNLCTAYYAEIDDLTFDSEGKNVLAQRLKQRRTEIGFLISMLELSPEMVAVVFHKGFTFKRAGAMDHVLRQDDDQLPDWETLADSLEMAPWTQDIVQAILKQPKGAWFMTVAAALEFMFAQPQGLPSGSAANEDGDDAEGDDNYGDQRQNTSGDHNRDDDLGRDDDDAERTREEAGADWMADQGFDRKD